MAKWVSLIVVAVFAAATAAQAVSTIDDLPSLDAHADEHGTVDEASKHLFAGTYWSPEEGPDGKFGLAVRHEVIPRGDGEFSRHFTVQHIAPGQVPQTLLSYSQAAGTDRHEFKIGEADLEFSGDELSNVESRDPAKTDKEDFHFSQLLSRHEFMLLPLMSREFGKVHGLTAKDHPLSAPLHIIAMHAAKVHGIKDLSSVNMKAPQSKLSSTNKFDKFWASLKPCMGRVGMCSGYGKCGETKCQASCNTRQLTKGECGSGCKGMCGPAGCDCCWDWVCGDCCWHKGCSEFRDMCAQAGNALFSCWSGKGVLWGNDIDSYKACGGAIVPPEEAGPYHFTPLTGRIPPWVRKERPVTKVASLPPRCPEGSKLIDNSCVNVATKPITVTKPVVGCPGTATMVNGQCVECKGPDYKLLDGKCVAQAAIKPDLVPTDVMCEDGFKPIENGCSKSIVPDQCPEGFKHEGSTCRQRVPAPLECPGNSTQKSSHCEEVAALEVACPKDTVKRGVECVRITPSTGACPTGTARNSTTNLCDNKVAPKSACPDGFSVHNDMCIKNGPSEVCPDGFVLENGACKRKNKDVPIVCTDKAAQVVNGSVCVTEVPSVMTCPPTHTLADTKCIQVHPTRLACPEGAAKLGTSCIEKAVIQSVCPAEFVRHSGGCVQKDSTTCIAPATKDEAGACIMALRHQCPEGFSLSSGECQRTTQIMDKCPAGFVAHARSCVSFANATKECPKGFTRDEEKCTRVSSPRARCPPEMTMSKGMCRISVSPKLSCQDQFKLDGKVCVKSVEVAFSCPAGLTKDGTFCVEVVPITQLCPSGFERKGDSCVKTVAGISQSCPVGYSPAGAEGCVRHTCPHGWLEADGVCVRPEGPVPCPRGYTRGDKMCHLIECFPGFALHGTTCVRSNGPEAVQCKANEIRAADGRCFAKSCPANFKLVEGVCVVAVKTTKAGCAVGFTPNTDGECVSDTDVCPAGSTHTRGSCIVVTNPTSTGCPVGSHANGTLCVGLVAPKKLACENGFHQVRTKCVAGVGCKEGFQRIGQRCVHVKCPLGKVRIAGKCVEEACPVGFKRVGVKCEPFSVRCAAGFKPVKETCVKAECPLDWSRLDGTCTQPSISAATCPTGYERTKDGKCGVILKCATGLTVSGSECVKTICPMGYANQGASKCSPLPCPASQMRVGSQCLAIGDACHFGYLFQNGRCVRFECPSGTVLLKDNRCVHSVNAPVAECDGLSKEEQGRCIKRTLKITTHSTEKICAKGWHLAGSQCIKESSLNDGCAEGYIMVDGACVVPSETNQQLICPEGYKINKGYCTKGSVKTETVVVDRHPATCPANFVMSEGKCVSDDGNGKRVTISPDTEVIGHFDCQKCFADRHGDECRKWCAEHGNKAASVPHVHEIAGPTGDASCPAGFVKGGDGTCVRAAITCAQGFAAVNGFCWRDSVQNSKCAPGFYIVDGVCTRDVLACPPGFDNVDGFCWRDAETVPACAPGFVKGADGVCRRNMLDCAPGFETVERNCVRTAMRVEACAPEFEEKEGSCVRDMRGPEKTGAETVAEAKEKQAADVEANADRDNRVARSEVRSQGRRDRETTRSTENSVSSAASQEAASEEGTIRRAEERVLAADSKERSETRRGIRRVSKQIEEVEKERNARKLKDLLRQSTADLHGDDKKIADLLHRRNNRKQFKREQRLQLKNKQNVEEALERERHRADLRRKFAELDDEETHEFQGIEKQEQFDRAAEAARRSEEERVALQDGFDGLESELRTETKDARARSEVVEFERAVMTAEQEASTVKTEVANTMDDVRRMQATGKKAINKAVSAIVSKQSNLAAKRLRRKLTHKERQAMRTAAVQQLRAQRNGAVKKIIRKGFAGERKTVRAGTKAVEKTMKRISVNDQKKQQAAKLSKAASAAASAEKAAQKAATKSMEEAESKQIEEAGISNGFKNMDHVVDNMSGDVKEHMELLTENDKILSAETEARLRRAYQVQDATGTELKNDVHDVYKETDAQLRTKVHAMLAENGADKTLLDKAIKGEATTLPNDLALKAQAERDEAARQNIAGRVTRLENEHGVDVRMAEDDMNDRLDRVEEHTEQ